MRGKTRGAQQFVGDHRANFVDYVVERGVLGERRFRLPCGDTHKECGDSVRTWPPGSAQGPCVEHGTRSFRTARRHRVPPGGFLPRSLRERRHVAQRCHASPTGPQIYVATPTSACSACSNPKRRRCALRRIRSAPGDRCMNPAVQRDRGSYCAAAGSVAGVGSPARRCGASRDFTVSAGSRPSSVAISSTVRPVCKACLAIRALAA